MKKDYIIIFDTNFIYSSNSTKGDFCRFEFNKNFKTLIEFIENNKFDCKVGIPEIVWKEVIKQYTDNFRKAEEQLLKDTNNIKVPDSNITIVSHKNNYENIVNEYIENYKHKLDDLSVEIVEIPFKKDSFDSIIARAINKVAPFLKGGDRGFKDAMIWESIMQYKRDNLNEKIIFITNDSDFSGDLIKEYSMEFNESIYLEKNIEGLKKLISDLTNKSLINKGILLPEEWIKTEEFVHEFVKYYNISINKNNDRTLEDINIKYYEILEADRTDEVGIMHYHDFYIENEMNYTLINGTKYSDYKKFYVDLFSIEKFDYYIDNIEEYINED